MKSRKYSRALDQTGAAINQLGQGIPYSDEVFYGIDRIVRGKEKADKHRKNFLNRLSYEREEYPITSFTGNVAGTMLADRVVPGSGGFKRAAALGALTGSGQSEGDLVDRALSGTMGALFGLGGEGLGRTLSRVAKGASDKISPQVVKTVEKLRQSGIKPRLSQITDGKVTKNIDKILPNIPFSGASGSQANQGREFVQALSKTFGENTDTLSPDVIDAARKRLGGEYDSILKDKVIPIDRAAFAQELAQKADELALTSGNKEWAMGLQNNILSTLDNNIDQAGGLTGGSYQSMRRLLKDASGTNANARELKKLLDDTVRKNFGGDISNALGKIDEQYRNMKIAEDLLNQSGNAGISQGTGRINPSALYNVSKKNIPNISSGGGGEMGELARNSRLLAQTVPDSNTAGLASTQNLFTQGAGFIAPTALGAGTGYVASGGDPTAALTGAALGVGAGAGANKLMTSPGFQNYAMKGLSQPIQKGAEAVLKSRVLPALGANLTPLSDRKEEVSSEIPEGFEPYEAIPEGFEELPEGFEPYEEKHSDIDGFLNKVAQAESGGNPNAQASTSSASGTFQFTDPTWNSMVQKYGQQTGITPNMKNDPRAQKVMAQLLTQENADLLRKQTGSEPDDRDLYMAHFLGGPAAAKAKSLLGRGVSGAQVFPTAARANQSIFFNNGRPRTVDEIYDLMGRKVGV